MIPGDKVYVRYGDGNHCPQAAVCCRPSTVLKVVGAFVLLNVPDLGYRGVLIDFVEPVMTAEILAARFAAT